MKDLVKLIAATTLCLSSFASSAAFIDFDNTTVDSYGRSQDKVGTVVTSGNSLELTGNIWKSIAGNFVVDVDTLLHFDIISTSEGEINGIGFNNGDGITGTRTFQIAGTQNYGNNSYDDYNVGDGWKSYSIEVGNFYTGSFDRLFFIMDDDAGNGQNNVTFRNVEVCQNGQCMTVVSAPSLGIVSLLFIGLVAAARKGILK